MSISIVKADITTLSVDAIVNAANGSLFGGGARHLRNACKRLGQSYGS